MTEQMEDSGVDLRWYHPPAWNTLHIMNNRTHRKILVVDGRVGFTGGADIADKWRGNAQNPEHWRDTHYRITGPVVGQLQAAFVDNWLQATGEILHGPGYFPEILEQGSMLAQVFTSARGGGSESMQLMYLLSIASARESIRLSSAYFIRAKSPSRSWLQLQSAACRCRLSFLAKKSTGGLVRQASRHRWGPLLEAGVEIYEYEPTMYHVKLLVVDGVWTSVGSSNFDPRSFSINDEANLNVYSESFAQTQIDLFGRDLKQARRVSLSEWRARSFLKKGMDALASLVGSQL